MSYSDIKISNHQDILQYFEVDKSLNELKFTNNTLNIAGDINVLSTYNTFPNKGDVGQKGENGEKGDIGDPTILQRGLTGSQGEKGVKGSKGQRGTDAVLTEGQKGDKGYPGQNTGTAEKGQKGQKGEHNSGINGQKGLKGIKGIKGEKGVGLKGYKGEQGLKGANGGLGVSSIYSSTHDRLLLERRQTNGSSATYPGTTSPTFKLVETRTHGSKNYEDSIYLQSHGVQSGLHFSTYNTSDNDNESSWRIFTKNNWDNGALIINNRYKGYGDDRRYIMRSSIELSRTTDWVITFTGQHKTISFNENIKNFIGYITSSTGIIKSFDKFSNFYVNNFLSNIDVNHSIPQIELSKKKNDKKCIGVISSEEIYYSHMISVSKQSKSLISINSLGEGAIWVSDINGNINNGDLITSSDIPGIGMKQDDDIFHNYTVAKATTNCNFNPSYHEVKYSRLLEKTQSFYDSLDNFREDEIIQYTEIDENSNVIYSNVYDTNSNIVYDWEYKLKYVSIDGTILDKETYDTKVKLNEKVYKMAFIGCTYHCG